MRKDKAVMMNYEARGLYLEDFHPGDMYCSQSRTLTETDVVEFAALSGDYTMLHTSEPYAKQTIHKERIAHGLLSLAISNGLVIRTGIFDGTVEAFLEVDTKFLAAVHFGDTLHTETKILETRRTKNQHFGIVVAENHVYNQAGMKVLTHKATLMVKCRET